MKICPLIVCSALHALVLSPLLAQTLYVPGGTGGISSVGGSNVGIGTASPGYKLDVRDATDAQIAALETGSGNNNRIVIGANANEAYVQELYSSNAKPLTFKINAEKMRLDVNGNLGIGTTSPGAKLDVVSGAIRADGGVVSRLNTAGGLFVGYGAGLDGSSLQTFALYADTTNGLYFDAPKDAFGNKFDVQFNWRGGGVPGLVIKGNTSNVGIGTASPSRPLEVASQIMANVANGGSLSLKGTNANSQPSIYFERNAGGVWSAGLTADTNASFYINNGYGGGNVMMLTPAGNVGVGTTSPSHKLAVNGTIRAKEVIVDTGWSDYVFADNYRLAPLSEVESHIKAERHLPGIPSAAEVAEHGISMGEMQSKLLAKIEELTLHVIVQEKRAERQQEEIRALREQLNRSSHD